MALRVDFSQAGADQAKTQAPDRPKWCETSRVFQHLWSNVRCADFESARFRHPFVPHAPTAESLKRLRSFPDAHVLSRDRCWAADRQCARHALLGGRSATQTRRKPRRNRAPRSVPAVWCRVRRRRPVPLHLRVVQPAAGRQHVRRAARRRRPRRRTSCAHVRIICIGAGLRAAREGRVGRAGLSWSCAVAARSSCAPPARARN